MVDIFFYFGLPVSAGNVSNNNRLYNPKIYGKMGYHSGINSVCNLKVCNNIGYESFQICSNTGHNASLNSLAALEYVSTPDNTTEYIDYAASMVVLIQDI